MLYGNRALALDTAGTLFEYPNVKRAARNRALALAQNAAGFTIGIVGNVPNRGCAVAIADSLILESVDVDAIADYVAGHASGPYWGIWQDSETGLVYVDTVKVVDRWEAIEIAKSRGEIAVWDFEIGEIRISDSPEPESFGEFNDDQSAIR
ncbi:hypothetical protein SEA_SHAGRAT_114 [Rhodococcus phage Shagrat]|nr:hypothetical protein SEA_SHAGRAT_114 [Rhodococcus phage Shagrat]